MISWKRYIPEGTRDLLFSECSKKINIVSTLRSVYLKSGFEEIATPALEFYDVFNLDNLSIEQDKMYKLFDNNGRILVLRPDMTTPIARVAATRLKEASYPLRICYSGNIFRMNESWGGKFSEITQSGIEILGSDSLMADSEVIITAIKSLLSIGIKEFEIELGQAEFFKALIEDIKLEDEQLENLRKLVENKNYAALREFVERNEYNLGSNVEALKSLPELFGGIEILEKAKSLTVNKNALLAIDNIADIYQRLDAIGLSKFVSVDLGMVQHINYYTGMTFRAYSRKVGTDILSGGRYDNLVAQFGENIPATGFGINIDNAMYALQDESISNDFSYSYFITYEDKYINLAYNMADKLRNSGYYAEISLLKDKESIINYCKAKKINILVSINRENKFEFKYMDKEDICIVNVSDFFKTLGE